MLWFFLALGSAFFSATTDAFSKKALKQSDDFLVAWVRLALAAPMLLVLVPFYGGIPDLSLQFFVTVAVMIPLEITALLLYMKAIRGFLD